MFKWVLAICGIGIGFSLISPDRSVSLGPGVMAPQVPVQRTTSSKVPFVHNGSEITPLADYSIEAKVLSRKNYRGRGSKVCPIDFALGWGKMSDESILAHFDISQSGRFYRWSTSQYPIPRGEIIASSANVHLVPANEGIKSILDSIKTGQIVYLEGKLVKVRSDDGWEAVSSLTREDSGGGACEVMYVEIAFQTNL